MRDLAGKVAVMVIGLAGVASAQGAARFGGGSYDGYGQLAVAQTFGVCTVYNTGGATEVGDTCARLNGRVDTGTLPDGVSVDVYVCWGVASGGAETGAWANVTSAGTRSASETPQPVSAWVTTLAPAMTYSYRFYAEDTDGDKVWATEETRFETFGLPDIGDISARYTGGAYDGYAATDAQGLIRNRGTLITLF